MTHIASVASIAARQIMTSVKTGPQAAQPPNQTQNRTDAVLGFINRAAVSTDFPIHKRPGETARAAVFSDGPQRDGLTRLDRLRRIGFLANPR